MKDKEMIEEMAKMIECLDMPITCFSDCRECEYIKERDNNWFCQELKIAKSLYNAGYRKLPEDSVVFTGSKLAKLVEEIRQEFEHEYKDKVILDKEEYNKVDDTFKMSISDHIAYLRENKRLKEDVQALIGMRFERFNLITKEESDKQLEQASKETAEKIICIIKTFSYDKEFTKIITRIITERFGVEIKE